MSHSAKHKGRSIAIVPVTVGAKLRRVSGDDRCRLAAPVMVSFILIL
jgi:hypothetical protein